MFVTERVELPPDGYLLIRRAWLDASQATALFEQLMATLPWEQRSIALFGRRMLQPRLIAWGGTVEYRYSGQTLPMRAVPLLVRDILSRLTGELGVPFNHVLINRYRNGQDSMGLHADDEPELGPNPILASLSLGAMRRFIVRPRKRNLGSRLDLELEHGSLLIMGGSMQHNYRHGVPKQPSVTDERINLTFRCLRPLHQ